MGLVRDFRGALPATALGVIVLANSGVVNPTRASCAIADMFLEKELGPRAPANTNALATAPAVDVSPAVLDRYTGLYKLGGVYVRVRRETLGRRPVARRVPHERAVGHGVLGGRMQRPYDVPLGARPANSASSTVAVSTQSSRSPRRSRARSSPRSRVSTRARSSRPCTAWSRMTAAS